MKLLNLAYPGSSERTIMSFDRLTAAQVDAWARAMGVWLLVLRSWGVL